jgi:hypothetical protein
MPRSRCARALLALTALSLLAAFCWQCRRGAAPPSDPEGLAAELRRLGYRVHVELADRTYRDGAGRYRWALGGVYLARQEPASWEEVAGRLRGDPGPWRGRAVAVRGGRGSPPGDPAYRAVGGWQFMGDPELLAEVAGRLAPP